MLRQELKACLAYAPARGIEDLLSSDSEEGEAGSGEALPLQPVVIPAGREDSGDAREARSSVPAFTMAAPAPVGKGEFDDYLSLPRPVSPGKEEADGTELPLGLGHGLPPVNEDHVANPELISPAEAMQLADRLRCCIACKEDDDGSERLVFSAARRGHPVAKAVALWFGMDDPKLSERRVKARKHPGISLAKLSVEESNRVARRKAAARRRLKKIANRPPSSDRKEEQLRVDAIGWYGYMVRQLDLNLAMKFYRKAAELGSVRAQYNIGVCLDRGQKPRPTREQLKECVDWYMMAAKGGHNYAIINLARMYQKGNDFIEKDDAEGLRLLRIAASYKDPDAEKLVAECFITGRGVPKDEARGVRMLTESASRGNAAAASQLGWMYSEGESVPKDDAEAFKWFTVAAERGDTVAQYNLACSYEGGDGTEVNYELAAMYMKMAALQRDPDAQGRLAMYYYYGNRGVQESNRKAARWYARAGNNGNLDARRRLVQLIEEKKSQKSEAYAH